MKRSSVSYNHDASFGGGASILDGDATFVSSAFIENQADNGGAPYVGPSGSVDLINVSTNDNYAAIQGGTAYNDEGTLQALHTSFFGDHAAPGGTSGIHGLAGSSSDLDRSIFLPSGASGTYCSGPVASLGGVLTYASVCFSLGASDIVGTTTGLSLCSAPTCSPIIVEAASPSLALGNAVPCGVVDDARGVTRLAARCDIGAWEAP
ncbi:MAG: hypothetical protein R3B72_27675 [Polyangiaceae bacterium]